MDYTGYWMSHADQDNSGVDQAMQVITGTSDE
jgi:hypothetical protein